MKHMIIDEVDGVTGPGRPLSSGREDLEAKDLEIGCMISLGQEL